MLHTFKNKLNEKRGATSARPQVEESARAGPSKKRGRECGNIAHTVREARQMPVPPPSRSARGASPATDDFNRPIPTAVAVPIASSGASALALLGGDRTFSRVVSFRLPSDLEEEIKSVPEDDLLDGGIEMICWGLMLARRGAKARRVII